jgi:hypothetical protein
MSATENDAFYSALQLFLESLPEKERKRYSPCASPPELLEGLQKLDIMSNKLRKKYTSKAVISIDVFSNRLKPYFSIIDVFIQSSSHIAPIIWGSLRLVLQVRNSFEYCTIGN